MARTFGTLYNIKEAGEYTTGKKKKSIFCNSYHCATVNTNVNTQSDLLLFKTTHPSYRINKTDLCINLITKLELPNDEVIPILDMSNNTVPAIISPTVIPYTTYNIDPSGNLFGNSLCGVNNFVNYMVYNPPPNI